MRIHRKLFYALVMILPSSLLPAWMRGQSYPCGGGCTQNGFWDSGNSWQASWYCNGGYYNCEGSGSFVESENAATYSSSGTCYCENG